MLKTLFNANDAHIQYTKAIYQRLGRWDVVARTLALVFVATGNSTRLRDLDRDSLRVFGYRAQALFGGLLLVSLFLALLLIGVAVAATVMIAFLEGTYLFDKPIIDFIVTIVLPLLTVGFILLLCAKVSFHRAALQVGYDQYVAHLKAALRLTENYNGLDEKRENLLRALHGFTLAQNDHSADCSESWCGFVKNRKPDETGLAKALYRLVSAADQFVSQAKDHVCSQLSSDYLNSHRCGDCIDPGDLENNLNSLRERIAGPKHKGIRFSDATAKQEDEGDYYLFTAIPAFFLSLFMTVLGEVGGMLAVASILIWTSFFGALFYQCLMSVRASAKMVLDEHSEQVLALILGMALQMMRDGCGQAQIVMNTDKRILPCLAALQDGITQPRPDDLAAAFDLLSMRFYDRNRSDLH